jgi:GT2 family glycosyltransferase
MTRLVVITPTLGQSPWLAETVASVAAHASAAIHVLVAPATVVEELRARFPHLRVVPEPASAGMYGAINAGLAAPGDWDAFIYLNDDDLLLPDFARMAAAIDGERPLIEYGGVRLIDHGGKRIGAIPISPRPSLNRLLYAQRIEPVYQHGTIITRRAFEAVGPFDASFRFCGDSEFFARACVAGVLFCLATRREVAAFRLHAGQLTKTRAAMIAERGRVDEKLQLLATKLTWFHRLARWRFRFANLPIYGERIARHGFISFDELLVRGG